MNLLHYVNRKQNPVINQKDIQTLIDNGINVIQLTNYIDDSSIFKMFLNQTISQTNKLYVILIYLDDFTNTRIDCLESIRARCLYFDNFNHIISYLDNGDKLKIKSIKQPESENQKLNNDTKALIAELQEVIIKHQTK